MKLNLEIDISGIFYRSLYTVGSFGLKKNQPLLSTEESKSVFMRKLATDFAALIRSIDNVQRVVICVDSSSWRKSVPIEEGNYKGTRTQDENAVDWEAFHSLTREFLEIVESRGYLTMKVKGAEADDLLYLLSKRFNRNGESVVIVTGDKDILQSVAKHENGSWTACLDPISKRRKISLTQEMHDSCHSDVNPEEVNLFDPDSWVSSPGDILFSLMSSNDLQIVDPIKIASFKVLFGDKGDAVPGVISWIDNKDPENPKLRSLSEDKLKKALLNVPYMTWQELIRGDNIELLAKELSAVSKLEVDPTALLKKIRRNAKLVILHEKIIPKEIQEAFDEAFDKLTTSTVRMSRHEILEGTKWWTDRKSFAPKGYDIAMDSSPISTLFDPAPVESDSTASVDNDALQLAIANVLKKNDGKGPSQLF